MYIPETIFTQSVARSVLERFVRDVIAFDEKPRSIRAKIEYKDWCYELLSLLIQEEKSNAVVRELSIILETTDDKHLRKALEDSVIRSSAACQFFYEKQCALKRKKRRKNNA